VKLTNGEIWNAQEPLRKLLEQKFSVMVSYKLVKLVQKLNEQFMVIEEVRNGLIKQYGKKDKKGNISVKPGDSNWNKFIKEFNELMEQEIEIVVEKIKLPDSFEIEPSVLVPLEKFIEV